jgi:hypothetical protein
MRAATMGIYPVSPVWDVGKAQFQIPDNNKTEERRSRIEKRIVENFARSVHERKVHALNFLPHDSGYNVLT